MKLLLSVACGLLLISCHPSQQSATASEENNSAEGKATGAAMISASPNPVPAGAGSGETTITWDTGEKQSGEVYVKRDDKPEERFVSGQAGSHKAKWIQSHSRYEFRLYEGTAHSKVLGKVAVTRKS